MDMTFGAVIFLFIALGFFVNILPCLLALLSKKARGLHKVAWFLMSFFLSWLGYLVYYFVVIKDPTYNAAHPKYDSIGRVIRQ